METGCPSEHHPNQAESGDSSWASDIVFALTALVREREREKHGARPGHPPAQTTETGWAALCLLQGKQTTRNFREYRHLWIYN